MTHAENIKRWQAYVKSKGWSLTYPAPHDRILLIMGFECPPSTFWSPGTIGLLSGAFFGVFWTTFMYFAVWNDRPVGQMIVAALIVGFCFGFGTAVYHWYSKKKLGIGTWEEFTKNPKA